MTCTRISSGLLVLALAALTGCPDPPAEGPTPPLPGDTPAATTSESVTPPPASGKRVAVFIPHEDLFWRDFVRFMEAGSEQLGLELTCYLAENNRELMKQQLRDATSGAGRVDAVVFQNFKDSGPDMLRIADEARVPAFLVNAGVDAAACGKPREQLPRWVGTMLPDDEGAGHTLAILLAEQAQASGLVDADGKVHMIALAGIVSDQSSNERVRGLERAVKERGDILLHQVVSTDWSVEEGELKARELLNRFPTIAVVWAASDSLALGAVSSLEANDRKPGVDTLVGGFDWTAEALEAVRSGTLLATIGGHFMEGGWVAVLLRDYLEGHDFGAARLEFHTPMLPITKANVERFQAAIAAAEWERVDFMRLTNPAEGRYSFNSVDTLRRLGE